jgi:hypothetical protein
MYRLYLVMKERSPDQITADEIAVASGQEVLDPVALSGLLQKLESANTTIQRAFERQVNAAAVCSLFFFIYCDADAQKGPWDQDRFEDKLAKWIVATDQPFYTVEDPEFRDLLTYVHHPSPNLKIPHRNAIKTRIMKMGYDTLDATKRMFSVCKHIDNPPFHD